MNCHRGLGRLAFFVSQDDKYLFFCTGWNIHVNHDPALGRYIFTMHINRFDSNITATLIIVGHITYHIVIVIMPLNININPFWSLVLYNRGKGKIQSSAHDHGPRPILERHRFVVQIHPPRNE